MFMVMVKVVSAAMLAPFLGFCGSEGGREEVSFRSRDATRILFERGVERTENLHEGALA